FLCSSVRVPQPPFFVRQVSVTTDGNAYEAENCDDAEVDGFLDTNKIGQMHSMFLYSNANHLELNSNIKIANKIYECKTSSLLNILNESKGDFEKEVIELNVQEFKSTHSQVGSCVKNLPATARFDPLDITYLLRAHINKTKEMQTGWETSRVESQKEQIGHIIGFSSTKAGGDSHFFFQLCSIIS
ncbi:hypothetical protein M8C21_005956, partial [Ambrosia artemisiifolia]